MLVGSAESWLRKTRLERLHSSRWKVERAVDPRWVQRCMLWLRELSCPSR